MKSLGSHHKGRSGREFNSEIRELLLERSVNGFKNFQDIILLALVAASHNLPWCEEYGVRFQTI